MPSTSLASAAAANNAAWCAAVVGTHGLRSAWHHDAWTCPARTPPLYPDAVTLDDNVGITGLLERIDTAPGCSIKDSFAALDLEGDGFRVLFDAEWITCPVRGGDTAVEGRWSILQSAAELARWVRARNEADDAPCVLRPHLLDLTDVAVVARHGGPSIVAGAIFNLAGGVLGLSNVFTAAGSPRATWDALAEVGATIFPAATRLVGYESGTELELARAAGFDSVGPLRVWLKD